MATRYVDTASSGGDGTTTATSGANAAYSSVRDFFDEMEGIGTLTEDWECICTGGEDVVTSAWFPDHVPNGFEVVIRAADDQQHGGAWNTSVYRIRVSGGEQNLIRVVVDGASGPGSGPQFTLRDLQVENSSTVTNGAIAFPGGQYGKVEFDRCVFRWTGSASSTSRGVWASSNRTEFLMRNCVVYGFDIGVDLNLFFGFQGVAPKVFNCTFDCVDYGIQTTSGSGPDAIVRNCISQGAGTEDFGGGQYDASSSNNLSEDATAPGSNSVTSSTLTFADAAAGDYRLVASDTDAIDAGADLSGDADIPITVDITGATRSGTTDIGAHEYAPSDTTAPVLSSPTATATGQTTATATFDTNEANGLADSVVTTSATPPSEADIQAGTGAVATDLDNTVSATGTQNVSFTGLTAGTTYWVHSVQEDDAGNVSNIVSATFTTDAPDGTPSITETTLDAMKVGDAFSQQLNVTGGESPYVWDVTAGSLPAGISLSAGGLLSGTPTASGAYDFTVRVRDENAGGGAESGTQQFTGTVATEDITGTVTLNAVAVSGALVYCIDQATDAVVDTTTTDVNGDYEFVGLASGTYHVVVESASGTAASVPNLVVT